MNSIEVIDEVSEFQFKLKNKEYISMYLYQLVKDTNADVIPLWFDLDKYNDNIIEFKYEKYKDYFDSMYKGIDENIKLDKEQIKAILADEEYSLIIAGAGTGKTTTMASKVKYLVDIKKVDPSKIIVMSYTRKATEELEKRILLDFGIPAQVKTFHSLGLMHIREIFKDKKCYVVDENKRNEIFLDYFANNIFPYKDKIKNILDIFNSDTVIDKWFFGNFFQSNYDKYDTFDKYFDEYKKYRLSQIENLDEWISNKIEKDLNGEIVKTLKGEEVKSHGEAIIANFLYKNNIEYEYEKIYEEFMPNNRIYRPDFTLNFGGDLVYLEYFGLSTYNDNEYNRYYKIRKMKEDYHRKHHNKFIVIDYKNGEKIEDILKENLLNLGFILKPKSNIEIYNDILDRNKLSQFFPFKNLMYIVIDTVKLTDKREKYFNIINEYLLTLNGNERDISIRQYHVINDFYIFYQSKLFDSSSQEYGFDFSDMIYYANCYINLIDKNNDLNFEYLIIDEYQDISDDRYRLTQGIVRRNFAKVVAVGDDWQSIFAFAGSKIEYIYNFLKYFPGAKLLKITNTYRNSKDLVSYKELSNPIRFVKFDYNMEYETLKELIIKIHEKNPEHNIMILARTNRMIDNCYNDPNFKDDIGTKITYIGYEDIDINGMTIHKAKGLTADEVIVIGLDQYFPSNVGNLFWMENLFRNNVIEEKIPFAEERRLFYVALTRTKNNVYLLTNSDPRCRSPFINELYNIIVKNKTN